MNAKEDGNYNENIIGHHTGTTLFGVQGLGTWRALENKKLENQIGTVLIEAVHGHNNIWLKGCGNLVSRLVRGVTEVAPWFVGITSPLTESVTLHALEGPRILEHL